MLTDVYRIAVDLLREHKFGLNHGIKYAIFPTIRRVEVLIVNYNGSCEFIEVFNCKITRLV